MTGDIKNFSIGISNEKCRVKFIVEAEYIPSELSKKVTQCLDGCLHELEKIGASNPSYFSFSIFSYREEILEAIQDKGTDGFLRDLLISDTACEDLTSPSIHLDERSDFFGGCLRKHLISPKKIAIIDSYFFKFDKEWDETAFLDWFIPLLSSLEEIEVFL